MMKRIVAAGFVPWALCLCTAGGVCEQVYELGEVVVSGTRTAGAQAHEFPQKVTVIGPEELRDMPGRTVAEVLSNVAGVDMRPRGPFGTQVDPGIRGSTFSQVLVLVDGMRMNDPQTGHHNMNLPLEKEDIERIEILHGNSSSVYGPDAFAGVINIITKKPDKSRTTVRAAAGEHDLRTLGFSHSGSAGERGFHISGTHTESDGFKSDRDFDINSVFSKVSLDSERRYEFSSGYLDKEFGAADFYSAFPSRELTRTRYAGLSGREEVSDTLTIVPKAYFRTHDDTFILDVNRPEFYKNFHTTNTYGSELQANIALAGGAELVTGAEYYSEEMKSTRLGHHQAHREAALMEVKTGWPETLISAGARLDHHSRYGSVFSPQAGLHRNISDSLKLRASTGRAFRAPSFTELFYVDPANIGDPDLKPEKAWSYEAGCEWSPAEQLQAELSVYVRDERDVIDWVRERSTAPWRARNIGDVRFTGTESNVVWKPGERVKLAAGYSYIDSKDENTGFMSKYALDYPRHHATFRSAVGLPLEIWLSLSAGYKERVQGQEYFLTDVELSRNFGSARVFLNASNVGDVSYEEVGGVDMPGRWLSGGIDFTW